MEFVLLSLRILVVAGRHEPYQLYDEEIITEVIRYFQMRCTNLKKVETSIMSFSLVNIRHQGRIKMVCFKQLK